MTSFIIFFNKDDIFRKKIKDVDLGVCFPDYKDGKNYEKALAFITKKYESQKGKEGSFLGADRHA